MPAIFNGCVYIKKMQMYMSQEVIQNFYQKILLPNFAAGEMRYMYILLVLKNLWMPMRVIDIRGGQIM